MLLFKDRVSCRQETVIWRMKKSTKGEKEKVILL